MFSRRHLNQSVTLTFDAPPTLKAALKALKKQLGVSFKEAYYLILLNGDRVDFREEKKRVLEDGAELTVVSAVAGG